MKHGTKSDRNKEIITSVLNGKTLQAVGNTHGISTNRVRTIVYEAWARINKLDIEYAEQWPLTVLRKKYRQCILKHLL